jgi:hypothetical protein
VRSASQLPDTGDEPSGTDTRERLERAVSTGISSTLILERIDVGSNGRLDTRGRVERQAARSIGSVTACSAFHRSRRVGAVRLLYVHPPRGKRTQPCSSCGPGAPVGAECHPILGSGENLSLRVSMYRALRRGSPRSGHSRRTDRAADAQAAASPAPRPQGAEISVVSAPEERRCVTGAGISAPSVVGRWRWLHSATAGGIDRRRHRIRTAVGPQAGRRGHA